MKQTTCYFMCLEKQTKVNESNLNLIQHGKQLSTSQIEMHLRRRNKSTICSTCTAPIAGHTSSHPIDFRHSLKLISIAHALAHDIVLSCNSAFTQVDVACGRGLRCDTWNYREKYAWTTTMASLWTCVSKNRPFLMSLMETLKILAWSVLGRHRSTTAWHERVTPQMLRLFLLTNQASHRSTSSIFDASSAGPSTSCNGGRSSSSPRPSSSSMLKLCLIIL